MTNCPGSGMHFYDSLLVVVLSISYFLCVRHDDSTILGGCFARPKGGTYSYCFLCVEHDDSTVLGVVVVILLLQFTSGALPTLGCTLITFHVPSMMI